jgi:hypothetical protein
MQPFVGLWNKGMLYEKFPHNLVGINPERRRPKEKCLWTRSWPRVAAPFHTVKNNLAAA